jgi:hypothetical protein
VRQRFLVICEGEQTEPNYFRAFQVPGLVIEVKHVGEKTLRLIEEAHKLRKRGDDDQVWCVFDRDDFPPDHIHRAIDLARNYRFGVAFSNQAFELWYLLHFDYHNTAITRRDYCERLGRKLGHEYAKNSTAIYEELLPYQEIGIRNARRLLGLYEPRQPAHDDPSTTVHELVEELNKYRRQ